jgi:hypothetical protein
MKRIKADMNSQRFAVIHIAKSLEKASARPKLVKEYDSPNTMTDRWKEEVLATTKTIRNLGNVLIFMFLALNKISSKLKVNRFKIPNYA